MMKKLSVVLIISLVLLLFSGCQTVDQNAPPEGYVRIHLLTGKTGDIVNAKLTYDESGNLLEIRKEANGMILYGRTYSYDDAGNVSSMENLAGGHKYTYDPQGNVLTEETESWRRVCTYDETGNILTEHFYKSSGYLTSETRYKYDSAGNLLSKDVLNKLGKITSQTLYSYDENGHCITETNYENDMLSDNMASYEYVYDSAGNLLERRSYFRSMPGVTMRYTYDAQGNKLSAIQDNSDGSAYEHYYTYDEQGNLTRKEDITKYDGKADTATYTYVYDDQGRLLEQNRHDSQGDYYTYSYTYDAAGNLIYESRTGNSINACHITYTHDGNGNLLTEEAVMSDRSSLQVLSYNAAGQKIYHAYIYTDKSGNETDRLEYLWSYDLYGNLISHQNISSQGESAWTYSYTTIDVPAELAQEYLDKQEELLFIVEEVQVTSTLW